MVLPTVTPLSMDQCVEEHRRVSHYKELHIGSKQRGNVICVDSELHSAYKNWNLPLLHALEKCKGRDAKGTKTGSPIQSPQIYNHGPTFWG